MSESQQGAGGELDEESKKLVDICKKKLEPLVKVNLQEKHLARPPIAFLKAIVSNLVKEKGYPEGLFDDDFLNTKKEMTVSVFMIVR